MTDPVAAALSLARSHPLAGGRCPRPRRRTRRRRQSAFPARARGEAGPRPGCGSGSAAPRRQLHSVDNPIDRARAPAAGPLRGSAAPRGR
jgi:hypothetical protein